MKPSRSRRHVHRATGTLLFALAVSGTAQAQPGLMAGSPEIDEATGELTLLLQGRASDGAPTVVAEPQLVLDSGSPIAPSGRDKLLDYAGDRPKWTPPLAIGVVYLWAKGTPQTLLDGLEALFRHVPAKVPVYPTPYGQGHRQVVTKLTAARLAGGDLADYPQIPGDQHKLAPAVQFNAAKLMEDRAPIKLLFIITDGRGSASGKEWGPFAALGEDLRRQGIHVAIVSPPAPVDAADAAANVQELSDAARARLVRVERIADLPAAIELLGESVSGFERVRFELPWTVRQFGGERRVAVKGIVRGASVRATGMTIVIPGRGGTMIGVVLVFIALLGGGTFVALRVMRGRATPISARRKPTLRPETAPPAENEKAADPQVAALAEVVRVGASSGRAVLALSRRLGPAALELARTDIRALTQEDASGVLATRAGQVRLREIRKGLSVGESVLFARDISPILAGTLREHVSPSEAARRLRARVPVETWAALLRLSSHDLDEAIASAGAGAAELASAAGRAFTRAVQAELQRPPEGSVVALWLVRVAGHGTAGDTIVVPATAVVGGQGAEIVLAHGDDNLTARHAEIVIDGNDVSIAPNEGEVQIDGAEIASTTPLCDGQTLTLGRSLFVVRLVRRTIQLVDDQPTSAPARRGTPYRTANRRR